MLRLPTFDLRSARSVDEAASILAAEGPDARIVAGGTDLWPNMKRRHQQARTVVSLRSLGELRGVCEDSAGELVVGSMTTLTDITRSARIRENYPALARAVASISSPVLRNMGTIGGNLCLDTRCTYYNQNLEWRQSIDYCMKEEGAVCWVAPNSPRCWAISASDSAPALCALGAQVRLASQEGERTIPLTELYDDDGIAYLTKRPDEILTEVRVPAASEATGTSFWKLRRRGSIDFAVLTVGAAVTRDATGGVTDARVFLGAVNSFPRACEATEQHLLGKELSPETIREAAELAKRFSQPMDNTDFLARWRGQMVVKYVEGALREIAGLDPGVKQPPHGQWVA